MDRVQEMHGFSNSSASNSFCMLEDCSHNEDFVCELGLFQLSAECDANRVVPTNELVKPARINFSEEDFAALSMQGASKGSQVKWEAKDKKLFIKERFQYQGRFWNDDLVEVIASKIGKSLGYYVVEQELCTINGRDAVVMPHFGNKKFVTAEKCGVDVMTDPTISPVDRVKIAIDVLNTKTGLDFTNYIFEMTVIDYLIGNEDRHEANFGAFWNSKSWEIPILFDFGLGLFEHDVDYINRDFEDACSRMNKRPFHDWDSVLDYFVKIGYIAHGSVDLSDCILPNNLARDYLKMTFKNLGLGLKL